MSSGERLTDVILSNRMSKKDFAHALGYNPSYITQICLNIKPPSHEFATKVEKFFGVSADWLIKGEIVKSSKHNSPMKETVLAKVEAMASDEELHATLAFINCYEEIPRIQAVKARSANPIKLNEAPKLYKIPVKGEVAGGEPIFAYEDTESFVDTPIFADSALYIKGKSMEPDYPDGSLLLIKENAYISNGDVVIALIMRQAEVAEATCKIIHRRKGKVTLSPINADYNVQRYDDEDGLEIKIFGKVIGVAENSN